MQTTTRLSREEDGVLRRLHFFETNGAELAPRFRALKQSLRARDLRTTVRDPFELAEPVLIDLVSTPPQRRGGSRH